MGFQNRSTASLQMEQVLGSLTRENHHLDNKGEPHRGRSVESKFAGAIAEYGVYVVHMLPGNTVEARAKLFGARGRTFIM